VRFASSCTTLALALASVCCSPATVADRTDTPGPAGADFFLAVANQYDQYTRYDNVARRAPIYCAAAVTAQPDVSRSDDLETHGQKLFYLYTRDRQRYMNATARSNLFIPGTVPEPMPPVPGGHAVTQILVKESFSPGPNGPDTAHPQDLFLMVQFPPRTPNTDDGWVFAVITPDRKNVKQFGLVESCVKCHATAPFDHQFGLPSR
jgi:hypothetical protein